MYLDYFNNLLDLLNILFIKKIGDKFENNTEIQNCLYENIKNT